MADKNTTWYGTGRRKSATARVFLRPGTANSRELDEFFCREADKMILKQPLVLTSTDNAFDITVTVRERHHRSGRCDQARH